MCPVSLFSATYCFCHAGQLHSGQLSKLQLPIGVVGIINLGTLDFKRVSAKNTHGLHVAVLDTATQLRKNSTEGLCSRSQTRSSKALSCPASGWFILPLISQFSPSLLTYFFISVLKDISPEAFLLPDSILLVP